jgi:uncharacterized protein YfdQ (DUF2303 family)
MERTENDSLIEHVKAFYLPQETHIDVTELDGKVPVLVLPHGMTRANIPEQEIDEARGMPRRRKGTICALSIAAFVELVNRNKTDTSIIYADESDATFVAVLNDHAPGETSSPGFRDYRVSYSAQFSEEWGTWTKRANVYMSQAEFAAFLEDHVLDLLDTAAIGPQTQKVVDALGVTVASPATLRGLARDLSVRIKQQVREARNLATGETQVVFMSEHATDDGRPLVVPGAFIIGIPVFAHGPLYAIVARLRYRITEGKIAWSYSLAHPENAKRDVMQGMLAIVREKTGVLVVDGNP